MTETYIVCSWIHIFISTRRVA